MKNIKDTLLLGVFLTCSFCANAATVYFVVSEIDPNKPHRDSYVLPLESSNDIAHARDLITNGTSAGSPIAVAHIAEGADGINRNILAAGEPLWSWHVDQFQGFADATIELIDGWPTFVESDVQGWINNTNGVVGFWSYTVTAELTPVPLPTAALFLGSSLISLMVTGRKARAAIRS